MRYYKIDFLPFSNNDQKAVDCSTVICMNTGSTPALINGLMLLQPGMGFSVDGYPGEMCNQNFEITFPNGSAANGNKLMLICKTYSL